MLDFIFNHIVRNLSQYFELIVALNIASLILIFLLWFTINVIDVSFRSRITNIVRKSFNSFLYNMALFFQLFIIMGLFYIVWVNYYKPAEVLSMPGNVLDNTYWIKNQLMIYFIDETDLLAIKANGYDRHYVFEANDSIREYHFSPDGKKMLIVTDAELLLLNLENKQSEKIDILKNIETAGEFQSVLSGVHWAPDSEKLCYEVSRWSEFSSQDNIYIYYLNGKIRKSIKSPLRRISSLYWDKKSENLYYLRHETGDASNIQQVKVFRIPEKVLTPEYVTDIPYDQKTIPIENLSLRGIDIFVGAEKISYAREGSQESWVARNGHQVGIDKNDHFYLKRQWFQQRLFLVNRKPVDSDFEARYQYKGGELMVHHIRWLPGDQYIIMEHRELGVLILDPYKNKIGQLFPKRGHTYGWYLNPV